MLRFLVLQSTLDSWRFRRAADRGLLLFSLLHFLTLELITDQCTGAQPQRAAGGCRQPLDDPPPHQ